MKRSLFLLAIIAAACSTAPSFEARTKKFVTDTIVPKFNDPKSFEWVGMEVDTFRISDYKKNVADFMKYRTTSEDSAKDLAAIDSLGKLDQSKVINIQVHVSYRAKNAMGALMLDKMLLTFQEGKFDIVRLQEKE